MGKIVLHLTPHFNFSQVQHFWSLKSKLFLSSVMIISLFVSHGILLNLGIAQNFSFDCELPSTVNFLTAAIVLIFNFQHYHFHFLWVHMLLLLLHLGRRLVPLPDPIKKCHFFPILYLSFGLLLSYPCAKLFSFWHVNNV